jgi:hypothetical protein
MRMASDYVFECFHNTPRKDVAIIFSEDESSRRALEAGYVQRPQFEVRPVHCRFLGFPISQ